MKKIDIILDVLTGSRSYNTFTPESDYDYRGIFILPKEQHFTILDIPQEVSGEGDTKYYELKKYFKLAIECNPNLIEILFSPEDCIKYVDDRGKKLIKNRDLFISKKCKHTFCGYAFAQIKRCKGTNKWINNPKPEARPKMEDFIYIVQNINNQENKLPARPVKYSEFLKNGKPFCTLDKMNCSKMEHSFNTFRLYYYGDDAKGVFRGDNLVFESIPLEDEETRFVGLMIFNEQEYNKEVQDWNNYWDWMRKRNPARWQLQERGELDFDAKNVMHTARLLYSGINILKNGEPIVRFTGDQLKFLKDIRLGMYSYEYLMKFADEKMLELDELYETSTLQNSVNMNAINNLYQELMS